MLLITPFSKDEALKYDKLLNDRNLLVHHAGIYTIKYGEKTFKKHFIMKPQKSRIYYDSLIINKKDFFTWSEFIEGIVIKMLNSSYDALSEFIKKEKIKLSAESTKALEMMTTYKP